MRVAIVSQTFIPVLGGAEIYVYNLARGLTELGVDVTILSSSGYPQVAYECWWKGFEIRYLPSRRVVGAPLISPASLARALRRGGYDVIHFSGPSINEDVVLPLLRGARVGLVETYHANFDPNRALSRVFNQVKYSTLNLFDRVIVTSNYYREVLTSRGVRPGKVKVVRYGIDLSLFKRVANARELLGLGDRPVVLFVGMLDKAHRYKRLDILIAAMALLRRRGLDALLIVVGDGELRPLYERMAAKLLPQGSYLFTGKVPHVDLPVYYSAADVLVLPSPTDFEGFGIVLIEALACETPIITTRAAGGAELVRESGGGLLAEPYSSLDLAGKIQAVLSNPEAAREMGARGREYVLKHHSLEAMARATLRLYVELSRALS